MVRKASVVMTDDIDGSPDAGTVTFGLDGVSYEIDLAQPNMTRLADVFAPFIAAGRRVTLRRPAATSRGGKSARSTDRAAVRAWARQAGMTVSERGRISAEVIRQYEASHLTAVALRSMFALRLRSCCARGEGDGQAPQAVQCVGVPPCGAAGAESQVVEPGDQGGERYLRLQPGQWYPQAIVHAVTEGHVAAGVAVSDGTAAPARRSAAARKADADPRCNPDRQVAGLASVASISLSAGASR